MLLAGCGGGGRLTKQEYRQEVLRPQQTLGVEAGRLFFQLVGRPLPRATCAAKARRFHAALEQIVAQVERLKAPQEIAALQARFVREARVSVALVGRAAADVAAGRLACGQPLNRRIYGLPSTERAEAVLEELQRRGYVFGGGD